MAKIRKLPSDTIIGGFKGTIDFYIHRGQPCARKWPASPGHKRAPKVEAQWAAFAWAAAHWNSLSPPIQEAYRRLASGTTASGRDLFTKSFISAMYLKLD